MRIKDQMYFSPSKHFVIKSFTLKMHLLLLDGNFTAFRINVKIKLSLESFFLFFFSKKALNKKKLHFNLVGTVNAIFYSRSTN